MYVSGRTVKSPATRPTTLATATRDAYRLAVKHLDHATLRDLVTVATTRTADPVSLDERLRTVITFPSNTNSRALATAVAELPGVVSVSVHDHAIVITRTPLTKGELIMANLDASTAHVVQHLRDSGFPVTPNTLIVETAPGDTWVETTVRTARRDLTWPQSHADHLFVTLQRLPGHPAVRRSAIRDRMVIIWDGV
jgi:hypothetical protein